MTHKYEIWVSMKYELTGVLYKFKYKKDFDKQVTFWSREMKKDKLIEEVEFKRIK